MTRQNFYVLVDKNTNTVLNHPSELPENWNNIHGTSSLTDKELEDLTWTGHSNFGWIKFDSEFPTTYTFANGWELFAKECIKESYSNLRWKVEMKGILYNGIEIGTDDRTRTAILLKKELMSRTSKETFSWKYNGSIVEFDNEDINKILNAINDYVQECFEIEASLIKQLDEVKTPLDLRKFDLNIEWPSNVYS
jgi:hypothetical protein